MNKIRTIKSLSCLSLLGFLLSFVLSCSMGSSPELKQEIEFWTMQLKPEFTEYFNQIIATFESENQQNKILWIDVPWQGMRNKILTAVSAKTAPDVVNLNPSFASQLATRNAWLDLNTKVTPQIQQQYLPNIWQASTIEVCLEVGCKSTTFGIPWYLTTRVTIYNQDLLAQAEINQPPKTYAELEQVADRLKKKTGKYAFFITFVPGDSTEVLESLVQMGVQLTDKQGKAAFNTPAGIAAFRYWVNLYQKGLLPPEVLTEGHRRGIELYQAGQTAIVFSGAEFLDGIALAAPDIAKRSAVAPQISGKTGKKNVAVMNLVIPRDTNKPDEAVKFALFVTNTKNQLAFAKAANVLPSTVEGIQQYIQELEQLGEATPVNQALKVSASQIKDAAVLVPAIKDLNRLQQIIYENLQAAMLKQKKVEQAVKDSADRWNQIISN